MMEGVPSSYDFESIKVSRQHSFPDVGAASHVLVPHMSLNVVGALNLRNEEIATSRLDLLAGQPTLYYNRHGTFYYDADASTEFEVLRTFSYDKEETQIEWIVVVSPLPPVFSKVFTSNYPTLWVSKYKGRYGIVDSSQEFIVTVHDQWRDNDKARGVTSQYVVRNRQHPMWREALWTAFSLRP